jgi:4-hydroxy 2-oxovalerate aldolase
MGRINLLDCTLRDGGYVNDWVFGYDVIKSIIGKLIDSKIDILEIGFMDDKVYKPDRTVFTNTKQMSDLIAPKHPELQYAGMIGESNRPSLDNISFSDGKSVDIIRIIIWKRLLRESYEYCKGIVEKGYKLFVQPARVDQYSHEEFIQMLDLYSMLEPAAIYVVDSFGTQDKKSILSYLQIADSRLKPEISLGYHGHNNFLQALGIAEAFLEMEISRDIVVDASIFGMGRGAGNLNLELAAKCLNENKAASYNIEPMIEIFDSYLKPIYESNRWGYSFPLFLAALHGCNPNYALFYDTEKHFSNGKINELLGFLSEEDKIIFSPERAEANYQKFSKNN